MITQKQQRFYIKILIEVLNANIDLKYNGYLLRALKVKEGPLKEKIKAYNIFFKSLVLLPNYGSILELNNNQFNNFLEKIRLILAENLYTLKIDEDNFDKALSESKKTIEFSYFLK